MKQAVTIASQFVADLIGEARDLRLEEITASGQVWHVVLSFRSGNEYSLGLGGPQRIFKEVEVERETGEPTALKVWKA